MKIEVRFVAYNEVLETEEFTTLEEAKEVLRFEHPGIEFKKVDKKLIIGLLDDFYQPAQYEIEEV